MHCQSNTSLRAAEEEADIFCDSFQAPNLIMLLDFFKEILRKKAPLEEGLTALTPEDTLSSADGGLCLLRVGISFPSVGGSLLC